MRRDLATPRWDWCFGIRRQPEMAGDGVVTAERLSGDYGVPVLAVVNILVARVIHDRCVHMPMDRVVPAGGPDGPDQGDKGKIGETIPVISHKVEVYGEHVARPRRDRRGQQPTAAGRRRRARG